MIYLSAADMEVEFDILYDKSATLAAPGFEPSEKSLFLSLAQERILKTRLRGLGNKYQEGFEQTEKRRKDFSELTRDAVDGSGTLTTAISANQNGTLPNGTFFDLPDDFLYAITERIETDLTCDGELKTVDVSPITHDEFNANKSNPFKKPDSGIAWRLDFSQETVGPGQKKRHEIITDGTYSPTKYFLRYIKVPRDIDIDGGIDCELDKSLHREIVNKAVEIALETVQDPRWQSKKADNIEIE
jgi:hypothetical protein